jgi:uncharacterized membrane protein YfcA
MKEFLYYLVVLGSNIIQGITGFAGTILAMPFSVMLIGIDKSKFILNFLGIVASIWILAVNYKMVNKKELKHILIFMGIGLTAGIFIGNITTPGILTKILPVIILTVAVRGLLTINNTKVIKNKAVLIFILLFSGLVHGMFVIGGPFLVIYASQTLKDKGEFRATLSFVWLILNSIIFISNFEKIFIPEYGIQTCISIIPLIIGMYIGNKLHNKMSQKFFMILSFVLLILSAVPLFFL